MKYLLSMDPEHWAWVFVEYEPGKRLTKDMVTFDTAREDVHVNKYGVVLFCTTGLAKRLLSDE